MIAVGMLCGTWFFLRSQVYISSSFCFCTNILALINVRYIYICMYSFQIFLDNRLDKCRIHYQFIHSLNKLAEHTFKLYFLDFLLYYLTNCVV